MGKLTKAVALCNNEVALIAWDVDGMIPGCLGFDVTRIYSETGERKRLAAWVPFEGQSNPDWKPQDTGVWPIQKTFWRDLTLRQKRDKAERRPDNVRVRYEIRPVGRIAPGLEPVTGTPPKTYTGPIVPLGYLGAAVTTNEICVGSDCGDVKATFTNGILSGQWLSHIFKGGWSSGATGQLKKKIATPGDPIRAYLSGDVIPTLTSLIARADCDGGRVHLALYELADTELVKVLVDHAKLIDIILSNTSADDKAKKVWDTENAPARQALKDAGAAIQDRMFNNGHIGHNKFAVYVDAKGTPQAVLTGSTNWTATGLCGQSNNASIIENKDVAAAYLAYWQRLHDDVLPSPDPLSAPTTNKQGAALRAANMKPFPAKMASGASATMWFLPDTKQTSKGTVAPPDLADLFARVNAAKEAVFFLVFLPSQGGKLSVVEAALEAGAANPDLLVVGAISDPTAMPGYAPKTKVSPVYDQGHVHVVQASALGKGDIIGDFEQELLKLGHAIIHDKIAVIDPMGDDPVVAFGSHNQGYKASYENDENLIIVRGNKALARAYATHVYDVYDHYRFRAWAATSPGEGFSGHLAGDDSWLAHYVSGTKGDIAAYLLGEPLPKPAAKPLKHAAKHTVRPKTKTAPVKKAKKTVKKKTKTVVKKVVKKTAKKAVKKTAKRTVKKTAKRVVKKAKKTAKRR